MQTQIDLIPDEVQGSVVSKEHLGINFVADYERIGGKSWEKFDDIATNMGATSIRYPGGVTAETVFDYRYPDRTEITLSSGEVVKLTSLSAFLQFCNLMKINPTIILPTAPLLSDEREEGHRTFDVSQADDLTRFVEMILSGIDEDLKVSFEIGNEYEGHMTSTEYGRIANALVGIVDNAFANVLEFGNPHTQAPDAFVQAWGYSVSGGLTEEDIIQRNETVIAQFSSENLANVDGVVSHYYYMDGRNAGTEYEQSIELIEDQISSIAELHKAWELATGREMISRTSEWNVLMRAEVEIGLRQLDPLMELFTSFLRNGFDALDFWSAQYKATSLADASGRLMAAGVLLDALRENIIGTQVSEISKGDALNVYTFSGAIKQVSVITSTDASNIDIDLNSSPIPPGYTLVDGFKIGVNEATADGEYRDLSGLPAYGEPDARVTLDQVSMSVLKGESGVIDLDPFECLILVFAKIDSTHQVIFGTDSADILYGSGTLSQYIGGAGWDTVSYRASTVAVDVDLEMSTTTEQYGSDTFASIESVYGSELGDRILGSDERNLIVGWGGDDQIYGMSGNDTLFGGSGDDFLDGGLGSDELRGDDGDDLFLVDGRDSVFGGFGSDTIDFSRSDDGITVWLENGLIESDDGLLAFSSIEKFIGTDFGDRFVISGVYADAEGGGGDDVFQAIGWEAGGSEVRGGVGNDSLQVWSSTVFFFGGSGNDSLQAWASSGHFSGGDGNDRVFVSGGSWALEGGSGDDHFTICGDRFVFSFSNDFGNDIIVGFDPGIDELVFSGLSEGEVSLGLVDDGTLVTTTDGDSIFLSGVSVDSLSLLQISFM